MKRECLGVGIILLCVGTCIIPAFAQDTEKSQLTSSGNWLYVGGSGPGNYTKIQDAIDDASSGDTVYVYNGVYNDHVKVGLSSVCVLVDKSITLLGENKYTTIIDANEDLIGIAIDAEGSALNWINISGFTIRNATVATGRGVDIYNWGHLSRNVSIYDNIITQNDDGFINSDGVDLKIFNNIITNNNEIGIYILGDQSNYITDNIISNNPIGISAGGGDNPQVIERNHFKDNEKGILLGINSKNTIRNNNFINNKIDTNLYKGPYALGLFSLPLFRNKWDGNYWDNWKTTTPKPILGVFVLIVLIPYPGAHFFPIPLGIFPYIAFDWHPAQEPYDIPDMN